MSGFLNDVISRLSERFDPEVLSGKAAGMAGDVLVGVGTFVVFYLMWMVADRLLGRLLRPPRFDATTASFTRTTTKVVLLAIGVVQALASAGINTAAVVASLGIAGLTIGFAARDALSNIISGLLIFWDRPFVIGDLVEVEDKYGRVERITLRSTRVITVDGRMLAVPNSTIINTTVASYTNFPHLRLDIDVTIGVNESIQRTRQLLLDLVIADPDLLSDPAPAVVVTTLGDYNVGLELRVWLDDERSHLPKRAQLREQVYGTLSEAGVDMPYETLQLMPVEVRDARAES